MAILSFLPCRVDWFDRLMGNLAEWSGPKGCAIFHVDRSIFGYFWPKEQKLVNFKLCPVTLLKLTSFIFQRVKDPETTLKC